MSIAICMATYNGRKYIDEQLLSILRQSYQDWVLYIHDDNSTDDTLDIIKSYVSRYPDKIILFDDNRKTGGASQNFSYLLKKVGKHHPYTMFCDQDDVWLDDKIEVTLHTMIYQERLNPGIPLLVHTDLTVVNESLETISPSMFDYQKLSAKNAEDINILVLENVITGCTVMMNRTLSNLVNYIPEEAVMHDWWIGLMCLNKKGKIIFLNRATLLYRQHAQNTVGSKKINFLYYMRKFLNLEQVVQNYNRLYIQTIHAGIKMNKLVFITRKTAMLMKKFRR